MRDMKRRALLEQVRTKLPYIEQRFLAAVARCSQYGGTGYPTSSGLTSDIGHDRGVGDPVATLVATLVERAWNRAHDQALARGASEAEAVEAGRLAADHLVSDRFGAERSDADHLLDEFAKLAGKLEVFCARNTAPVAGLPDYEPPVCDECGREVRGTPNDPLRRGLCDKCRKQRERNPAA